MKGSIVIEGLRYVQYPIEEGETETLTSALANPIYVGKFLTLDQLLYLQKHFSDYRVLFLPQGKILGERVAGREHVCSSLWWNSSTIGINETMTQGLVLPGKKGYTNYLLVRKD